MKFLKKFFTWYMSIARPAVVIKRGAYFDAWVLAIMCLIAPPIWILALLSPPLIVDPLHSFFRGLLAFMALVMIFFEPAFLIRLVFLFKIWRGK